MNGQALFPFLCPPGHAVHFGLLWGGGGALGAGSTGHSSSLLGPLVCLLPSFTVVTPGDCRVGVLVTATLRTKVEGTDCSRSPQMGETAVGHRERACLLSVAFAIKFVDWGVGPSSHPPPLGQPFVGVGTRPCRQVSAPSEWSLCPALVTVKPETWIHRWGLSPGALVMGPQHPLALQSPWALGSPDSEGMLPRGPGSSWNEGLGRELPLSDALGGPLPSP